MFFYPEFLQQKPSSLGYFDSGIIHKKSPSLGETSILFFLHQIRKFHPHFSLTHICFFERFICFKSTFQIAQVDFREFFEGMSRIMVMPQMNPRVLLKEYSPTFRQVPPSVGYFLNDCSFSFQAVRRRIAANISHLGPETDLL